MRNAYQTALNLLSRREHSAQELQQKLAKREFAKTEIDAAMTKLVANDYQSDERFASSLIRSRVNKGYGPLRIRQELKKHAIKSELVEQALVEQAVDWQQLVLMVWQKKYGAPANNLIDRAKQTRFLQYRGFSHDLINKVLNVK